MRKGSRTRFAVCIDNSGFAASLERHEIYRVIPNDQVWEDGDLRVQTVTAFVSHHEGRES
jgi:hypothetical protein